MYTLYFPFQLLSGREIKIDEKELTIGNLVYSIKGKDRIYSLTVKGFLSEEQAREYIRNIRTGLYWILIDQCIPSEYSIGIDQPIVGIIDSSKPAVFLNENNLRTLTTYAPNVIISSPSKKFIRDLIEGASYLKNPNFFNNMRLITALDLYGAHFKELSNNAKFLILVMALEALTTKIERPKIVLELINKWKNEIKDTLQKENLNDEEKTSLKAIFGDNSFKKEESIRQKIRHLIKDILRNDNDVCEVIKKTMKVYGLRSKLVHEGKLEANELAKAISDAQNILERVLRVQFTQSVSLADTINNK